MIKLSEEQEAAKDNILNWMHSKNKPVESLAGYAGTGKTTLLAHLAMEAQKDPAFTKKFAFLTFTGKATSVLSGKMAALGVDMERNCASTIHSAIYRLVDGSSKNLEWARTPWLKGLADGKEWVFIVDEASMINDKILADLKKNNLPILLVGDPGQLPPVEGKTPLELTSTRNILATVHRQAWENPIIRMATSARFRDPIPFGVQVQGVARLSSRDQQGYNAINDFMRRMKEPCSQIMLCATNRLRQTLNSKVRDFANYSGIPQPGEKVVCLANNKDARIMNGQLFYVHSSTQHSTDLVHLSLYGEGDTPNNRFNIMAYAPAFGRVDHKITVPEFRANEQELKEQADGQNIGLFDFGYALTVHKSQGSEWDAVVLYNERMQSMDDTTYARWLYTGITRAKERLLIVN